MGRVVIKRMGSHKQVFWVRGLENEYTPVRED
jgi:hypothetical protein